MARQPGSKNRAKKRQHHFDDVHLRKHRDADCKYRSKVQYLYAKLKEMLKNKRTKDGLLDGALVYIQDIENEICEIVGSENMQNCKEEFLSFLLHEETLWKKEKDLSRWWSKVKNCFNEDQSLFNGSMDIRTTCREHCKSCGIPAYDRSPSSVKNQSKKLRVSKETSCCSDLKETAPVLQSFNVQQSKYVDASPKDEGCSSSSSWNVPELVDFMPNFSKTNEGVFSFEETQSNDTILSEGEQHFFSIEVPLEVSRLPMPVENVVMNNGECTPSTFLYL